MSNNFYKDEYMPKINRIGKMTGYVGVILAFLPAVALAVVYGLLPKPAALLTAFVSGASAFWSALVCGADFLFSGSWSGR